MQKFSAFILCLVFCLTIGCTPMEVRKGEVPSVPESEKTIITVTREEFEKTKESVSSEEEAKNIREKIDEKIIFKFLLEEELKRGYREEFTDVLMEEGVEVPPYEEVREYLKNFFLSHGDGKKFVREFNWKKERYKVIVVAE